MTIIAGRPGISTVPAPPRPARNIYLSWQGIGLASGHHRSFDVLCGANPPTITDGYAITTTIPRPMQRALTIPTGYNPMQMVCDVIFGKFDDQQGWLIDDTAGQAVEADIADLEWMAGSNFVSGPSPVIYVYSHSNQGGDTGLVPSQYRGMPWIVATNGLAWGTAIRNDSGYRIWQEATITLLNYLNLKAPPKPDLTTSGGYFTTRPGANTTLLIAGAPSSNSPTVDQQSLAYQILGESRNNPCKGTKIWLSPRAITWQIRSGVPVWVPGHQVIG